MTENASPVHATAPLPDEYLAAQARRDAAWQSALDQAADAAIKPWEVPLALILGAMAGVGAYAAQANLFAAVAFGAALAALTIARAAAASTRRTQAAVVALIALRQREAAEVAEAR